MNGHSVAKLYVVSKSRTIESRGTAQEIVMEDDVVKSKFILERRLNYHQTSHFQFTRSYNLLPLDKHRDVCYGVT